MKRLTLCLLCLLAPLPGGLSAGEKPLPPDLALVPADGLFFLHVRLQDVYMSDHFKEWRETLTMAGIKALESFDSRFFPAPSSLDRVTVFVPKNSFEPVIAIRTSKAIDKAAFLKYTIPDVIEEKGQGTFGSFYRYPRKNLGFVFADDKTLVAGSPSAMLDFMEAPRAKNGNLSEPLRQANSGHAAVLAVNLEFIPPPIMGLVLQQSPPPMRALLEPASKAKVAAATVDLRKEGQLDLRLVFADAKQAAEGEAAARQGIKMARAFIAQKREEMKNIAEEMKNIVNGGDGNLERLPEAAMSVFTLGMLNRFDDYLAAEPIKKNGLSLTMSVKIPKQGQAALLASAASLGLFSSLPRSFNSIKSMAPRPAASPNRVVSTNNLKQIALAVHSYHDVYKKFPAAAICDPKGKPLLSWRVAILPYVEQNQLYNEFKLDEPWDSEHNKKLIARMPEIYVVPAASKTPKGETHYLVFVGNDKDSATAFELTQGIPISQITDGTSNTIMCVEASKSVPWTKPEDIPYDAKKPLPKPADFYGNGIFLAAFCDGSVRAMRGNVGDAQMRALITCNGGEVVDPDD